MRSSECCSPGFWVTGEIHLPVIAGAFFGTSPDLHFTQTLFSQLTTSFSNPLVYSELKLAAHTFPEL
jgi:hypothetical protein